MVTPSYSNDSVSRTVSGSIPAFFSARIYFLYSLLSLGELLCSTSPISTAPITFAAPPTWSWSKCVTMRRSSFLIPRAASASAIVPPKPFSPQSISTAVFSVVSRMASALSASKK